MSPATPKARVFISSVMDQFETFRAAARRGVVAAGHEPVMAEEWSSLEVSSRNACLDAVASSDALIVVVGERGGWKAPSGKLVVEEEWAEAKRRKMPVRVFLQEGVERDAEGDRLARELSDYVDGYFRRTFTTAQTLANEVERALAAVDVDGLSGEQMEERSKVVRERMLRRHPVWEQRGRGTPRLRFITAPKRTTEMIDPRMMDEASFQHFVMSTATSPGVGLVRYGEPLGPRVTRDSLMIGPVDSVGRPVDSDSAVRIEVSESGFFVIDVDLMQWGRENAAPDDWSRSFMFRTSTMQHALSASFQFVGTTLEHVDPYRQFENFWMDAAVFDRGRAQMVDEFPVAGGSRTIPLAGLHGESPVVTPMDQPRALSRTDFREPADEVSRLMARLRRELLR